MQARSNEAIIVSNDCGYNMEELEYQRSYQSANIGSLLAIQL